MLNAVAEATLMDSLLVQFDTTIIGFEASASASEFAKCSSKKKQIKALAKKKRKIIWTLDLSWQLRILPTAITYWVHDAGVAISPVWHYL